MLTPQPRKNNPSFSPVIWHMLAGAVASLSLPPLFLLPAIFALSIPLLGYLNAESRRDAALILSSAGVGWFLASTYWVSNSLCQCALQLVPYAFYGTGIGTDPGQFLVRCRGFIFFFWNTPVSPYFMALDIFKP